MSWIPGLGAPHIVCRDLIATSGTHGGVEADTGAPMGEYYSAGVLLTLAGVLMTRP
jgi:hypothetical protein